MTTFLITFGIICFLVLIMAVGVLFGRKPIAGSCGGYETLKLTCAAGCKKPCKKRLAHLAHLAQEAEEAAAIAATPATPCGAKDQAEPENR